MSILWERCYILHFPLPLCTKDTEQEIPGDALQSWRILHWTNWLKSSKTRLRAKLQRIKLNNLIQLPFHFLGQLLSHVLRYLYLFSLWIKSLSVTIQMKATEQQFPVVLSEMPTSGDLKLGDCLFFTTPPPPKYWPSPQWEWLRTLYGILHDLHTIKIRNHRFDARNNLCQWLNTCKNAPETVLRIRKIQVLS